MATAKNQNTSLEAKPKAKRRKKPAAKAATPKKRRRKSGHSGLNAGFSGTSFSVFGSSLFQAGTGALVQSVANKMAEGQTTGIRIGVCITGPIALMKVTGKPFVAAGAAGVSTLALGKILAPQNKFLNDYNPGALMDGFAPATFVQPRQIQNSSFQ